MLLSLHSFDVSVTSLTFRIVAGLRQSLTVRQHGNPRHGNTHNAALFARLVLQKRVKKKKKAKL